MNANINVSETKPPEDPDSPLAFTMEGSEEVPPSSLVSYYWIPGWNSYQAMNFYLDEPNGSMKGGDPGIRLIDDKDKNQLPFFESIPSPFIRTTGEWMVVPVYRIFGSEELSSKSSPIAELIEDPFAFMNTIDAKEIQGKENDIIKLTLARQTLEVKLKINDSIPFGIVGLSIGLPGMPFVDLPDTGKLKIKKSDT